jgi:hypothetical protein
MQQTSLSETQEDNCFISEAVVSLFDDSKDDKLDAAYIRMINRAMDHVAQGDAWQLWLYVLLNLTLMPLLTSCDLTFLAVYELDLHQCATSRT